MGINFIAVASPLHSYCAGHEARRCEDSARMRCRSESREADDRLLISIKAITELEKLTLAKWNKAWTLFSLRRRGGAGGGIKWEGVPAVAPPPFKIA